MHFRLAEKSHAPFLSATFGAAVGATLALRVGRKDALARYAVAAGGTCGWTGLGFCREHSTEPPEEKHAADEHAVLRGAIMHRNSHEHGARSTIPPAIKASAQAAAVCGGLAGALLSREFISQRRRAKGSLRWNIHPGNLIGVVGFGIGSSLVASLGQVALLASSGSPDIRTEATLGAIMESFRLKDPAMPNGQEVGVKNSDTRRPAVSDESNPIFIVMETARAWWNGSVEIPEWAYLRVEGEKEQALNSEIELLRSEVATLRSLRR